MTLLQNIIHSTVATIVEDNSSLSVKKTESIYDLIKEHSLCQWQCITYLALWCLPSLVYGQEIWISSTWYFYLNGRLENNSEPLLVLHAKHTWAFIAFR